ncbi:MAG: VWA domain-containing protein [Clostridiaceae bacterium]|nr:VWA domain-containing protein [Clostridiaceae bacterium]
MKLVREDLTELVFILDRSGSMAGLEDDTIGGFNSMIAKQKDTKGEVVVTTVLFNDEYEVIHDRINIKDISPMTKKEYDVGGCTALLDAIGKTILKISKIQENASIEQRAGKVLFIIITDGMENSSTEFTYSKIKELIKTKKQEGWEFIFLGANIDAAETADRMGIGAERSSGYHADSKGIRLNYRVLNELITNYRENATIDSNWNSSINEDFVKRNKLSRFKN